MFESYYSKLSIRNKHEKKELMKFFKIIQRDVKSLINRLLTCFPLPVIHMEDFVNYSHLNKTKEVKVLNIHNYSSTISFKLKYVKHLSISMRNPSKIKTDMINLPAIQLKSTYSKISRFPTLSFNERSDTEGMLNSLYPKYYKSISFKEYYNIIYTDLLFKTGISSDQIHNNLRMFQILNL